MQREGELLDTPQKLIVVPTMDPDAVDASAKDARHHRVPAVTLGDANAAACQQRHWALGSLHGQERQDATRC